MENYKTLLRDLYSDARIVVWGAGERGKRILNTLEELSVQVFAFGDNAAKKWNTEIAGIPCYSKQGIIEEGQKEKLVIISSPADERVYEELKQEFPLVYRGGGYIGTGESAAC